MITVNKQVTVTIDGEDVETLKNIATAAMVYIKNCGINSGVELENVHSIPDWKTIGQFYAEQAKKMVEMADAIFES